MNLSTSSYFSVSNYEGIPIRIRNDEERLDDMQSDNKKSVETSTYKQTFDLEEYFDIELPVKSNDLQHEDFFYFEKPTFDLTVTERLEFSIPDLARYIINDDMCNKANLTATIGAIDYLLSQITKQTELNIRDYQNYMRESCIIDLLITIIEKIYRMEDIEKGFQGLIYKLAEVIVKALEIFIHKNNFSAHYCYQWKDFFINYLQKPQHLEGKTRLELLISSIFEMTDNYFAFLQDNLKNICGKIDFKDLNQAKLTQFLSIIKTSIKMKDSLLDELILNTVIFSEYKDKIFYPFVLNSENLAEVQLSKGKKLTLDSTFCLIEEKEVNYLVDLIEAAAVLTEMAPNRVAGELKEIFPSILCVKVSVNSELSGNLRGAFIKLYKSLYVMGEIPKYDIISINSDVIINKKKIAYMGIEE